jgi:hypothetical protein
VVATGVGDMLEVFPMVTKRALLETAALAAVAAAGTAPRPLLAQERIAQAGVQLSQSDEIRARDAQSEAEWYYSVGVQNYVFALPLRSWNVNARYG